MTLIVGQAAVLKGDVTQLFAIGAKAPDGVEKMLGYHAGRLRRGYWICVLLAPLEPRDFEFSGTTLRSGGREGLPRITQREDKRRPSVHDAILADYGSTGYVTMQNQRLAEITATGRGRLVKIVPVTPHAKYGSPAKHYPMGGGALQWTLKEPGKTFYVAAFVNDRHIAETPDLRARVDTAAPYDDRARLFRYLEIAPRLTP